MNDGKNQYLYNADGQICAVEWTYNSLTVMTGYIYDADGNRVAKGTITTMSCDPSVNGFTTQADYVRDQVGHQLSEFVPSAGTMAWLHTNIYANGVLIATDDSTETHFYLNDWLGTRRVQTDYQGTVEQTCASLPYGDNETCAPTPTENLFTGKERDNESGNDYFGARYYASTMARWLSPDWSKNPEGVPYADFTDPQSLNLYGYVNNNPLSKADPNGHDFERAWEDIKASVTQVTATISLGLGIGIQGTAFGATGKLEGANTANISFTDGNVSISNKLEGAISAGTSNKQFGLAGSVTKIAASFDSKSGSLGGAQPATTQWTLGGKSGGNSAQAESGSVSIGAQEGEGVVAGGSISISREGVGDLRGAWSEIKSSVTLPPPPPPPAVPPPPPQASNCNSGSSC